MKHNRLGRHIGIALLGLMAAALLTIVPGTQVHAAALLPCVPTGSGNTTAARVNPPGVVSGSIDAAGCTYGVFYGTGHSGAISSADIFGASSYGVIDKGGSLMVQSSHIHNDGCGILYEGSGGAMLAGNSIDHYSGVGISSGGTGPILVQSNSVSDNGAFAGIWLENFAGQTITVKNNSVTNNSTGILIMFVDGGKSGPITVQNNLFSGNKQVGIEVVMTTNALISGNAVMNGATGILDKGTGSRITSNFVCTHGGTPINTSADPTAVVFGNFTSTTC